MQQERFGCWGFSILPDIKEEHLFAMFPELPICKLFRLRSGHGVLQLCTCFDSSNLIIQKVTIVRRAGSMPFFSDRFAAKRSPDCQAECITMQARRLTMVIYSMREVVVDMSQHEVTETELAILDVLWEQGPVPVRRIVDALYGAYRRSLHASVKSLLDRLMEKGFVEVDASEFAHRF